MTNFLIGKKGYLALAVVCLILVGAISYAYVASNKKTAAENDSFEEPAASSTVLFDYQFNIDQKVVTIDDFLPDSGWKDYEKKKFSFKYPKDWYVFDNGGAGVGQGTVEIDPQGWVSFATTPTGSSYDFDKNGEIITYDREWARITFGTYKKAQGQSLENWLKEAVQDPAPGIDAKLEHVKIGKNEFIGSFDFKNTGSKNAYIELPSGDVLKISFQHKAPNLAVDYTKIYHTMLKDLTISR